MPSRSWTVSSTTAAWAARIATAFSWTSLNAPGRGDSAHTAPTTPPGPPMGTTRRDPIGPASFMSGASPSVTPARSAPVRAWTRDRSSSRRRARSCPPPRARVPSTSSDRIDMNSKRLPPPVMVSTEPRRPPAVTDACGLDHRGAARLHTWRPPAWTWPSSACIRACPGARRGKPSRRARWTWMAARSARPERRSATGPRSGGTRTARRCPGPASPSRCSTATTTSWWWTSRPASSPCPPPPAPTRTPRSRRVQDYARHRSAAPALRRGRPSPGPGHLGRPRVRPPAGRAGDRSAPSSASTTSSGATPPWSGAGLPATQGVVDLPIHDVYVAGRRRVAAARRALAPGPHAVARARAAPRRVAPGGRAGDRPPAPDPHPPGAHRPSRSWATRSTRPRGGRPGRRRRPGAAPDAPRQGPRLPPSRDRRARAGGEPAPGRLPERVLRRLRGGRPRP